MSTFRSYVWDPILIIAQILAMQCAYYLTLGTWIQLVSKASAVKVSLGSFFRDQELLAGGPGWLLAFIFLLNSLTSAFSLLFIVRRAKSCLDFSATVLFFHFIACVISGGFPGFVWWVVNILGLIIMSVFGEYVCMRSELSEIPLLGSRRSA
eukprot:Colp12_sorted_trinity150504_noHs@1268